MSCIHEVKKKKHVLEDQSLQYETSMRSKTFMKLTVSPVTTLCSNSKHFCNC